MHREVKARKAVDDARQAVIKACADLREAEMFLDAVKADERSAVGGAAARVASIGDLANTHRSNLREQAQPCKVLRTFNAPEEYAESQLLEAASLMQKVALGLGSSLIRHWFDEALLARAQDDLLQIQVAMLEKLQRLNARSINDLHASQGDDHGHVAAGDVENELVNVPAGKHGGLVDALSGPGGKREGELDREELLGVVGDCVDSDGGGPSVA